MDVLNGRILLRPGDLDRSRRFYRDTLGLAVTGRGAGQCAAAALGNTTCLTTRGATSVRAGPCEPVARHTKTAQVRTLEKINAPVIGAANNSGARR
jgi:catechol 2,3-dioxygenase-like lactoylglutathione lyase family enzyme